ncbi:YycH family regulatory protein [Lactobacillaceae bacterium Scapto_B20]
MRINRLGKHILPLLLTVAVILSVYLSASLWLNPSHYKNNNTSSSGTNIKSQLNNKPISEVYAPTQLMHNDTLGNQHLLVNQSVNLIGEIKEEIQNYQNVKVDSSEDVSKEDYLKMLQKPDAYILNYSSTVTMPIVNEFFNKRFKHLPNYQINRIVLPLDDNEHIYLLRDDGYHVYKLSVKKHSLKDLNEFLTANKMKRINVDFKLFNKRPLIYFKKDQAMPQYAYLVNVQQQNYYVTRLLGEAQNFNIKHRKDGTVYNDQDSKQVTFYNNNDVKFIDERPKTIPSTLNQTLFSNYDELINSGVNLDNVRFFGYEANRQLAIYRGYVEGFPIFNNINSGLISMQVIDNSSIKYQFSLANLQIPVPSGVPDIKLPSTSEVLKTLHSLGYKNSKLNGIELGYSWHGDAKSDVLVNLIPTWFIKYGNNWYNYNDIIDAYK